MKIGKKTQGIKPSVTLALAAKAQVLRAEGVDLVNFTAGEPDFDTPQRIKDAAVEALKKGMTKYTDVRGIEPLRQAIVEKYRRDYGLEYTKDEVLVSCGGKHALYNILQALIDDGDEVVIPSPYWVSYSDIALLAGGVPKLVETSEANGFRITPADLEQALTPKTRMFILNSPSNPTGAAYTRDELEALSQVLERHDCVILSDDIYEKIVYDGFQFHQIAALNPKLRDRTVITNAVSKTYAMTGWRIGYALGPKEAITAASKIQSQSTSNPTSIAQAAALEAIRGPQDEVPVMVGEFKKRRDAIVARLQAIRGVTCFKPQGAFYVFPDVRGLFGKKYKDKPLATPADVVEYFLEAGRVLAVPGEDFGSKHNVRISYATSMQEIEKGCARIAEAVVRLG
ncbi:MAG TPA: pyridoxal phosphate-dependent aminotransferase [Candidatus Binatia bacterium]|nr:pyridoxal phosphate-dependent aminotransferase [Candidatus Binatia bacterium]